MKATRISPIFRMIFCHAPLPINKKSSIACNLMHYYKSVYMSKGKKQDLTPSMFYIFSNLIYQISEAEQEEIT